MEEDFEHTPFLHQQKAHETSTDDKSLKLCEQNLPTTATTSNSAKQISLVLIVMISQFCALCPDTFIFPFFPVVATEKGLTEFHFGLVYSAYELARFIMSPVYGSLLSKVSVTHICTAGCVITALSCLAFGFLDYMQDFWLFLISCIVVRLISGNGYAMLSVSASSILLKSTSFSSNTIIALVEMVDNVGYICGPSMGALFYMIGGYRLMFWVMGAVLLILSLLLTLTLPLIETESASHSQNFFNLLLIPGILLLFINDFVLSFGAGATETNLPIWILQMFGTDSKVIASFWALWAGVYIVLCPIVARMVNQGYVYSLMIPGLTICAVSFLFMAPSFLVHSIFHLKPSFILVIVTNCVYSVGLACIYITRYQASMDMIEVHGYDPSNLLTIGLVVGMLKAAHSFGAMLGPTLSGVLTQEIGFEWTCTIISGPHLLFAVIWIIYLLAMKACKKSVRPERSTE